MNETSQPNDAKLLPNARARVALWVAALVVLLATFAAYDQAALALQWVVMKLC
jgi:hypothetical protein